MKCPKCGAENKRTSKFCSECGSAMSLGFTVSKPSQVETVSSAQEVTGPFWRPDRRWHIRALVGIYAVLIVVYFAVNLFLSRVREPYRMRDVPKEMTPWLKK